MNALNTHHRLVISNGKIFTATGQILDDGYVIADGGRMAEVGQGSPPQVDASDCLDAGGRWVLPGLIDAHCHLCDSGPGGPCVVGGALTTYVAAANARTRVLAGVTTVRDVGGPNQQNLALKQAVAMGLIPAHASSPRATSSTCLVGTATGGQGRLRARRSSPMPPGSN